jgi:hypothetical protein
MRRKIEADRDLPEEKTSLPEIMPASTTAVMVTKMLQCNANNIDFFIDFFLCFQKGGGKVALAPPALPHLRVAMEDVIEDTKRTRLLRQ